MAKKETESQVDETNETEEDTPKIDGRIVKITDPSTGEQVRRTDWIKQVFSDENGEYFGNRGKIAKKLTELEGRPVPYQIVFAATKEIKGPAAARKQAQAEAKAAEAAEKAEAKAASENVEDNEAMSVE